MKIIYRKHIYIYFIFFLLAGIWNVIARGMGNSFKNVPISSNGTSEDEGKKRDIDTPLASQSLLLLLILTNHCTTTHNPYRDALFSFTNVDDDHSTMPTKPVSRFRYNLDKVYNTICKVPNTNQVTLLLYMLLHRNPCVKEQIIKRPDIQLLVRVQNYFVNFVFYIFLSYGYSYWDFYF